MLEKAQQKRRNKRRGRACKLFQAFRVVPHVLYGLFGGRFGIFDYAELSADLYNPFNEPRADAGEHTEQNDDDGHYHTAQKPDNRKHVEGDDVEIYDFSVLHEQARIIRHERENADYDERELIEYISRDRQRGSDSAVYAVL